MLYRILKNRIFYEFRRRLFPLSEIIANIFIDKFPIVEYNSKKKRGLINEFFIGFGNCEEMERIGQNG